MRVYFAHPIQSYGSRTERRALAAIRKHWEADIDIVNPGASPYREAFELYYPIVGMSVFELVAAGCQVFYVMPFPFGAYGAGCMAEVTAAHRADRRLYRIDPKTLAITRLDYYSMRPLSIKATRAQPRFR